jgi:ABC-2 type transport system permease protein
VVEQHQRDSQGVAASGEATLVDIALHRGPLARLGEVWRARELLVNLIRKELKVKYKSSALGFIWSLLNPVLYLVVFSVVFSYILPNDLETFPLYLLSGLVAWNFFSAALGQGAASVVANAALVTKVSFPREVLPLAAVGAALFHFFLQSLVLFATLLVFRWAPGWEYLAVLPLVLLAVVVLASACAIALSAINVRLRDTQHLLELVLLAWFWLTPIIYPFGKVADKTGTAVALLNPMTTVTTTFQRALYNRVSDRKGNVILPDEGPWWYVRNAGAVLAASIVLLYLALRLFAKRDGDFAEEI